MTRSKRRTSHAREIYYILCIMFIFGFALYTIFGRGGYFELRKARLELETHRSRVDSLRQDTEQKVQAVQQLKFDKNAQEKYAREKGGYGKKTEIVQQVPEDSPKTQQESPPTKRPPNP